MKLCALAISDPDPILAELCLHATIAANRGTADPVACGACLIEPATTAATFSPPGDNHIAYGLCPACYAAFPGELVCRLVERNIASGRLVPQIDDFDADEEEGDES